MTALSDTFFLDTIYHLRTNEEVILYTRLIPIETEEESLIADFLETEYSNECLEYPHQPPAFDKEAALWGARTLYTAAQLLLYRDQPAEHIPELLPAYPAAITPAAMLSADLCLRFLPQVLDQVKRIDPDDPLIPVLENLLTTWHYSGIRAPLPQLPGSLAMVFSNTSLQQLYINRIISKKAIQLAAIPTLNIFVKATLGNYKMHFWKEV